MRVSFRLAIAYLKKQKGRTLALIISIALAIILVFALNVIPESKSKYDIKEAYKNFSDYHVEYSEIDSDTIEQLKNDNTVKEINDIKDLGNIVSDKGVSISLNSYSKNFLDAYGYKLIKGNSPKNENEIVIEEKALKEMGLENKLSQNINFSVIKKYVDENEKNQIYSKSKSFKLVGIVQKPNGYYEDNLYFKVKAFTYYNKNQDILPKELVTHSGVLKFKTKEVSMSMTNKAIQKYKLDNYRFMFNVQLNEVLQRYSMIKNTKFTMYNKLVPVVASTLVIYNIFNIILIEMTKQIGMLRSLGMSKLKVRHMIFIQSLLVLLIGLLVGFLVGGVVSYIGLQVIYQTHIDIYVSKESIVEPMTMAIVAVFISSIFVIYRCGKVSPMEAIRSTSSSTKSPKNRFYYRAIRKVFGLTGEMAYKNLWRYKVRTILSILSISVAGALFITKMVMYNRDDKTIDKTSMTIMTMGESDIILSQDLNNADPNFNGYTDNQINNIKNIDGVKELTSSMDITGYMDINKKSLSKDYEPYIPPTSKGETLEVETAIKGYSKDGLKMLNQFIESGSTLDKANKSEIPNALISNSFYSTIASSNNTTTLNNLKVGDIVKVKLPVKNSGEIKYKDQEIKVAGILSNEYVIKAAGGMGSNFQVIMDEDDYKELTGHDEFNKIYIKVKKGTDEKVISSIGKIIKNSSFKIIESKFNQRSFYTKQSDTNKREVLVSVVLTLVISSINIVCIVITNIMIRLKEISTLRAIGMSMKNIKRMIVKESVIYGVLSIILASVVSTYDSYVWVKQSNEIYLQGLGIKDAYQFNIPIVEILQFSIAAIFICVIAGYLAKNKVGKLSIVEGLRDDK